MTQQLPSVCVIGAGSSGIAAAKALHERGIPFDCFEKSDRVGGNWVFGNKNGMSSAYRSLHINTSRERMEYTDFPMPKSYPDFPHHTPDRRLLRRLRRPLRLPRPDPLRDGRRARRARGRRQLDDRARHGGDAPLRRARRRQRPPLGPALARAAVPRQLRRRRRRTRTTTSTTSRSRADASSSSGSATARWTSRSSRASSRSATFLSLAPRRARHPQVPVRPAARPDRRQQTSPARCRGRSARRSSRRFYRVGVGRDGGLRPAETRPRPRRRAPDDLGRLPQPHRARRDRLQAEHRRAAWAIASASRTARVEQVDAIVWCTGYKVTFPFFDPDLISAPDNDLPLFRRVFHPEHRQRLLRRPAAAARRDHAARRGAGAVDRRLPARRVRAARRRAACAPDMERERAKMFKRYVASKRHTMQVDFDNYLYALGRERRAGARRVREHGFRLPVAARAAAGAAAPA